MPEATQTILIIEDDFFVRDLYDRAFKRKGYNCVTAVDGVEGLAKVKSVNPNIVLLDIMLPKENGIDVLKEIKGPNSAIKGIPVYLLTNLGQEEIIKDAFKIGADGYLLKAKMTPDQVVAEVEAFLRGNAPKQNPGI
jgi:DNA-binding response OmpR family regulator